MSFFAFLAKKGRSWSRSESTIWAGVGVVTGLSKILSTPTPVRSRTLPSVSRRWFRPKGFSFSRKHGKTGRKEEWYCVLIKLKRYLVMEFDRTKPEPISRTLYCGEKTSRGRSSHLHERQISFSVYATRFDRRSNYERTRNGHWFAIASISMAH